MTTEIPADMVPFVQRLVSERRFLNAEDVLAEGLRLLQAREALREEVGKGFAQLDGGQRVPAADVYARMEARIQPLVGASVPAE
ncbi:type II toxin-antitoxin system ParD family antitoxin [Anatilimnocola sp. NA78]|uniref:ribbon-helix-helix domain-containing protein n=1 Tax=Anatilimnocola sp. NA78 TaxID=3415683 RepID=UPI003CE539ED